MLALLKRLVLFSLSNLRLSDIPCTKAQRHVFMYRLTLFGIGSDQMSVESSPRKCNMDHDTSKPIGHDPELHKSLEVPSDTLHLTEPTIDINQQENSVFIKQESRVVDFCLPEPATGEYQSQVPEIDNEPEYQQESAEPITHTRHLKREGDAISPTALPKRVKLQQENPILEETINPARLPSTEVEASSSGHDECSALNTSAADVNVLTRAVIDLSCEKAELKDALQAKEKSLARMSEQLENNKKDLHSRREELRESENRIAEMVEDLREQKELRRNIEQGRQAAELERRNVDHELKEMKQRIWKMERDYEKARTQDKNLHEKLRTQVETDQKTIQTLHGTITTFEENLSTQDGMIKALDKSLSRANKKTRDTELRVGLIKSELHIECAKVGKLMARNQELTLEVANNDVLKKRLLDMYLAYEDVRTKNATLVNKMENVLQAGTFGGINKKDRKALNALKSCPVEELEAYQEM